MAISKYYNASVKNGGGLFDKANSGRATVILIIIAAIIIIVLIMFYIIWLVRYYNHSSKTLINSPKALDKSKAYSLDTSDSTAEHSYSFWVYYKDVSIMDSNKIILMRTSNLTEKATGKSLVSVGENDKPDPTLIVASVKGTNRLFVSVPIIPLDSGIPVTGISLESMFPTSVNYESHGYVSAVIDYIPIQQWVHIAIVCRKTEFTIYMNGDVYSVKTSIDKLIRKYENGTGPLTTPKLFASSSGKVVAGDNSMSNALMNKLVYHNFAISHADVISSYNKGPTSWSLMSWLRIGNMRLQSPVTFEQVQDDTV